MTTQAYFQNIRNHIKDEISNATQSIYVAVAWFTDKHLFKLLCDKVQEGVDVQLIVMDDDITRNSPIIYRELETSGGKLYQVSETFGTLMHNKFCVIDKNIIITGSYNWSVKAATNHENITITKDAESLALTFIDEFKRIKERYHGNDPLKTIDYAIVNKRILVIDKLLQLEDYDDILPHTHKLKEFELSDNLLKIIRELEEAKWVAASNLIKDYLKRSQSVTIFDEVKSEELKWKIKYLELEIVALENEKNSIQKIISDFVHIYTIKFGELLEKILKLKKEKLKAQGNSRFEEYKKAEDAYNDFKNNFNNERKKEKDYTYLSDTEKEELRKKYRKAASLCHPDAVANKFPEDLEKQKKAEELFKILNVANEKNDLKTVSQILQNLENGIYEFEGESVLVGKREVLEARLTYLKEKLDLLRLQMIDLRNDNTYKQVLNIRDFDTFYQQEEERLQKELKNLENEHQLATKI